MDRDESRAKDIPLYRHRVDRPTPVNAPGRRHNALTFRHLADFAQPRDWICLGTHPPGA